MINVLAIINYRTLVAYESMFPILLYNLCIKMLKRSYHVNSHGMLMKHPETHIGSTRRRSQFFSHAIVLKNVTFESGKCHMMVTLS